MLPYTLDGMDNSYFDGSGYDPEAIAFYDVAHEGAQVRTVSGVLDRLAGIRGLNPRSLVVLPTDQVARAAARFVLAHRSPLRLPMVVTDTLPAYVGALDIVIVVGDRADDPEASQSLIGASRRGAVTVLAGPARGPLLDDAPDDCLVIPALPTAAGASPARSITAISTVLNLLEESPELVEQRLLEVAAAVDTELEQLSPDRDELVNPGRQLRRFVEGAQVLHSGRSRTGRAVAELVATLWSVKGLPSGMVEADELAAAAPPAPATDLFHDPFLDSDSSVVPLRTVLWAEKEAGLAHALAVDCETPGLGRAAAALQLITRGFSATAYDVSVEDN